MRIQALAFLFNLLSPCLGTAAPRGYHPSPRTAYQYPNPTWLENIAVRSNGIILVTVVEQPEVREINLFANPPTSSVVATFPGKISVLGIAESSPDIFAVISGNYTLANGSFPGTFSVYTVDFTTNSSSPSTQKITDLPDAGTPNGMDSPNANTLLIADSKNANVIAVNIETGDANVILEDETMTYGSESELAIGINGVKIYSEYLYFTNTYQGTLVRVPMDFDILTPTGPYEIISRKASHADDFALSEDGSEAYVALNFDNAVLKVCVESGEAEIIAGGVNSTVVPGATGTAIGRGEMDQGTVYVSTGGGLGAPINGTFTEGGKVLAVWS